MDGLTSVVVMILVVGLACPAESLESSHTLSFYVQSGAVECAFEDFHQNTSAKVVYSVVKGGMLDIVMRVDEPSEGILVEDVLQSSFDGLQQVREKSWQVHRATTHRICFDNSGRGRSTEDKLVKVEVRWEHHDQLKGMKKEVLSSQDVTGLSEVVLGVYETYLDLWRQTYFFKVTLRQQMELTEEIQQKLWIFTSIEFVILLLVNFLQVFFLKRIFLGRP
eukprot:TRINITY_DN2372_c0_g5_i1.p1 TRINITY_DN2372_c0_g5~~TRINITY_DN2372_c0_g5_i1.p1  ORF type:complete len:221 (+),score=42.84 TRINITY_DN2372_c0_g5_i1:45-707(+)